MKRINNFNVKYLAAVIMMMAIVGCERELSDDAELATFSKTAEIFTDNFIGLGTNFYFPFATAKADVFSVDETMGFESNASIRIDVPNADDPGGGFAGGIFRIDGSGRDLTDFDALTFYGRASQAATLGQMGFGVDFEGDVYRVSRFEVDLTTNWQKFVIPIPDASLLTEERGMLIFAAGGIGPEGMEVGYTFWIDELKFENLGTIGQSRPMINAGAVSDVTSFTGGTVQISGFSHIQNVDGQDVSVGTTPAYFNFTTSNPEVATVDENGLVSVIGVGEAQITASLGGVEAKGAINIKSEGGFVTAPVPTLNAEDVLSIYSDVYTNVPASVISNFGGQTSTLSSLQVGNDNILFYQNVNFFGIEFNSNVELPLIDGSGYTTLHLDVLVPDDIPNDAFLNVALRDAGPNGMVETDVFTGQPIGDDSQVDGNVPIVSGEWVSLDLNITGLTQQSALAQIAIFSPDAGPNEFYVDNIYLY